MNPLPDTPALFLAVPGHTRLFRRAGGTYYLRAKVPYRLRPIIGKTEIRKSLETKDYKEGLARVKPESMRVDRILAEAEAKFKGTNPAPRKHSREELVWAVSDWFIKQEGRSEEWAGLEVPKFDEKEKATVLDSLSCQSATLARIGPYTPDDGSKHLDAFLSEDGSHLRIEKGSEDYNRLLLLFRQALEENTSRTIDRVLGTPPASYNPQFAGLHANTILPPAPRQTVIFGKFLDDFMDYQRREHSNTTPAAYALAVRILREVVGENKPMHTILRQDLDKVFDVLRHVPVNMTQRYPGLTAEQAIKAAQQAKDTKTLAPKTLRNNYILIKAIFNYAVEEQFLSENPAKGRKHRDEFKVRRRQKRERPPFTQEELYKIFHAPLYTGCKDDERGYAKVGPLKPRRGRFWLPLLGLFQGLRSNEACQLYTKDIGEENGVPYLYVRETLDEEEVDDKRVKGDQSWRKVPIHPEILKIGFLDYVEAVKKEGGSGRLFSTIHACKNTGRYSKPFSKWFARFVEQACGYKPKAVFHSFRHNFRSGLDKAGVQTSYVEMLGGWTSEGSSEIEYRHADLPDLQNAISKLSYPGLNLSHLYKSEIATGCKPTEPEKPACRVRTR